MFTMNLDGRIRHWNEGVKVLLGYDEHEFVGMDAVRLFSDEDREAGAPRRELDEALEHGEAQDDRWHVRKNGELRWVNGMVTTIRDEQGEPCGFVKIMRDQTEMLRAHARLGESQERFGKAFRSSPTPIALMRLPDGELTDMNEAFTLSFARSRDDLRGQTLAQLLPADAGAPAKEILDEVRDGRPVRREATFRRNASGAGYGSFAFEPVEIGGEPYAVLLMHDVTEWRAAQAEIERQKAIVEGILVSLPGIFYMVDGGDAALLVRWNHELERITGYDSSELDGMRARNLVIEEDFSHADIQTGVVGRRVLVESRLRCKDGSQVPYLFTLNRTLLPDGQYVVGVGVSIEEQKRTQRTVARRARHQSAVAELAASLLETVEMDDTLERTIAVVGDALHDQDVHVLRLDDVGDLDVACASDHEVAERRANELKTMPIERMVFGSRASHVASRRSGDEADDVPTTTTDAHNGLRAIIPTDDGPYGLIEALISTEHGEDGEERSFLETIASLLGSAVTRHRLLRNLAHEAEHDQLTGLPNRLVIEVQLEGAIERAARANGKVGVVLLDLDHFKHVNDSLGHHAGDELLELVADRLRESIRGMDTVARLGGDEFVLVVPDIDDEAEVAHVAERVLASFEQPFVVAGRELAVKTTLGVALYPDDGKTVDSLLRSADGAMYVGKTSGRGVYRFATAERGTTVGDRLELERDLREAVASGQLELAYQPQVALATDDVVVVEALVRWRHPVRGVLLPESFLPLAQEIGLASQIDEWAVRAACTRLRAFDDAAPSPLRIAVNIATRHLVQPSFPERMVVLAREAGVAPEQIEIELDESALMEDAKVVAQHLGRLVELGFRLALDDFGKEFAALARVRSLPFERLKIDESHIHELVLSDGEAKPLAGILIEMGAGIGLDVVAEGVESVEQRRAVERHGCGYAQGRLFAGAMTGDDLVAFLRSTT